MTKKAHFLAALFIFGGNAAGAVEGCDLSSTLAIARSSLAAALPEAILSIRRERIALISHESVLIPKEWNGDVQLLELRDGIAVEVGTADLVQTHQILSSFDQEIGDTDAELIVGSTQSAYLGENTCHGSDWTAAPVSPELYEINGVDVETRLTLSQAYRAVMMAEDPRLGLVPALSIDLRLGERLGEEVETMSDMQPSLVLRPIMGRLSTTEVHIPTFALNAPRDTWLSDEIRYLSRIEEAEWQLGKATWEFSLSYSSGDQTFGSVYFPISNYWSGELGSSFGDKKSVSFVLDRAVIWPEQDVLGSLSFGRLDDGAGAIAASAVRDLGQAQLGGYIGLSSGNTNLAVLLGRSFGSESHALAMLEVGSSGSGFSIGWSQKIQPRITLETWLIKDAETDKSSLNAGLSFALSAKEPVRLLVKTTHGSFAHRSIARHAETLRLARGGLSEGGWSAVLD